MALDDRADTFLRLIRRDQRGRLKIYLGYSAGVGKTFQMLLEGHRIKEEGIDVVIGLVVTHGRIETEKLVEGLEVIPAKRQEYRGIAVEEMDVDAILARKPQVVLIDELAHTNVPGSRNMKRYQDVQEVLAAGIHVITTLNLQHLESLYDTVEKAVGVKVQGASARHGDRRSRPDRQCGSDSGGPPPEAEGRQGLYAGAHRGGPGALLQGLEPREAAGIDPSGACLPDRSEEKGDSGDETPVAPDQVMVCLSSRGPNSEMLLRYASRMAGRLNRNWYAVYVQTPSEEPTVIDAHTQRMISDTLTLAKQLGGLVFTFKGQDVSNTILRFAKEYRVGHIVIGSPTPRPLWQRLLGKRSVVESLIHEAKGITLTVLDTRKYEAEKPKALEAQKIESPVPEP